MPDMSDSAAKLWKLYVKRLYADRLPRSLDREALVLAIRRAVERSDLKLMRIGPEEDPGRSYSIMEIRQPDGQRIDVLMTYGIVGFAAPPVGTANRHWAWKPCTTLAEALTTYYKDFTVATPADLATPLTTEMLADLLPADRKLLQAHKPETLGNVIFHSVELEDAE